MRELSFSQLWPKLAKPRCTTFRFARKDKDWQVGETVKVLYKARSHKDRSVLGLAVIVAKEPRWLLYEVRDIGQPSMGGAPSEWKGITVTTEKEAQADGFTCRKDMYEWVEAAWGKQRLAGEPMNKLTLAWTQYWLRVPEQKPHIQQDWAMLLTWDRYMNKPALGSMRL